jgi:hypothetical protein
MRQRGLPWPLVLSYEILMYIIRGQHAEAEDKAAKAAVQTVAAQGLVPRQSFADVPNEAPAHYTEPASAN